MKDIKQLAEWTLYLLNKTEKDMIGLHSKSSSHIYQTGKRDAYKEVLKTMEIEIKSEQHFFLQHSITGEETENES